MAFLRDRIFARCEVVDDCWIWKGKYKPSLPSPKSQPIMMYKGRFRRPIKHLYPGPLKLERSCPNKFCQNPDHFHYPAAKEIAALNWHEATLDELAQELPHLDYQTIKEAVCQLAKN